jgi:trans-aconitate methyltransferase
MSINSREYWELRFKSRNWQGQGGNAQTQRQAEGYCELIELSTDFAGTIVDVGCAEGDAFPIYRRRWPSAKLIGVDFSESAIAHARAKYGDLADFMVADFNGTPNADVIICSHVLEHIEEDAAVVSLLMTRCSWLFVIVPYRESPLDREHLRAYDEQSYASLSPDKVKVGKVGWHFSGWRYVYNVLLKNFARTLLRRPTARCHDQIVFRFRGLFGSER